MQHFWRFGLIFPLLAVFDGCGSNETRREGVAAYASAGISGAAVVNSGGTTSAGAGAGSGYYRGGRSATASNAAGRSGALPAAGTNHVGGFLAAGGKSNAGGSSATGGEPNVGANATAAGAGGKSGVGGSAGAGGFVSTYRPCPTDGTNCRIMPFGDSITDGFNSDTPGGYRVELFRLAHSEGKKITFVGSGYSGPDTVDGAPFPHNHEGHSGWTIAPAGGRSGVSTLVATVMPQYTPHIVLLMIGTNDAIDDFDMANAPGRLGALIDSIYAQLPNVLLVVAQPIPSRGDAIKGDDVALSARIKTFNDAISSVVKSRADAGKHILLVDMYTPYNPNKAFLFEDQWHPNLAGYVLIGAQWYAAIGSFL